MVLHKEIMVNTGIARAWQILGVEFADASRWASAVYHSEGKGIGLNGSSCSERGCETSMGRLKEKLLQFEPASKSLTYQIETGLPGFVKFASNTWQLIPETEQKTRLRMTVNVETTGLLGRLMAPMLKMQLTKLGNELAEEFKYYVEHGTPHPRKLKSIAKHAA